jgi:CDP-diacylglycerol--serine O-phosphatidyltransferase
MSERSERGRFAPSSVRSIARAREDISLNRGVYLLPNLLTTAGLFCGVFSIAQTLEGFYFTAALAILTALLFDILDGLVARMTKTTSAFGIEYDSLCDLVSFGVAPALLIFRWALEPWGVWGWLATALIICCAALRLARFNTMVGTIGGGYFMGLPVPASATALASFVLMYSYMGKSGLPDKHVALLLVTYALAALMVSAVPYPSFKKMKLHKRQPLWLLVVAILVLKVLIARLELVVFSGIALYIATGPAIWLWRLARGSRDDAQAGAPPEAGRA